MKSIAVLPLISIISKNSVFCIIKAVNLLIRKFIIKVINNINTNLGPLRSILLLVINILLKIITIFSETMNIMSEYIGITMLLNKFFSDLYNKIIGIATNGIKSTYILTLIYKNNIPIASTKIMYNKKLFDNICHFDIITNGITTDMIESNREINVYTSNILTLTPFTSNFNNNYSIKRQQSICKAVINM